LRGFMHNGLDAAWIDDSTRGQWRAEHTARFDTLRADLPASTLTSPPAKD
jgi:hypothetical protein